MSSRRFLKEWGVKKEKPLELGEDIRELFEILSKNLRRTIFQKRNAWTSDDGMNRI
jgi:hypothetical protein